jgi:hypothetical protein
MATKITTNNVPRDLLNGWDLTEQERADLDYIAPVDDLEKWSECSQRFFRYRGQIYDVNEFVAIVPKGGKSSGSFAHYDHSDSFAGWDGIQTDSFFSGIVIRYCDNYERVVVGLAIS